MRPRAFRHLLLLTVFAALLLAVTLGGATVAQAHQSGCHAVHSCPSDTGSYTCGDLGYYTYCGGSSAGLTIPPPSAYFTPDKDCADFSSQQDAQNYFLSLGGPNEDPDQLDRDADGLACEWNQCPCATGVNGSGESPVVGEAISGSVEDPHDVASSTLDITGIHASYEGAIGRVTVAVDLYSPLPDPLPMFLSITWEASSDPLGGFADCWATYPNSAELTVDENFDVTSTAHVAGHSDYPPIAIALSSDRRTLTTSYRADDLRNLDLRCVRAFVTDLSGNEAGADRVEPLWFTGFGPRPACANGRDDDSDGRIDLADPGCLGDPNQTSESNPIPPAVAVPKAVSPASPTSESAITDGGRIPCTAGRKPDVCTDGAATHASRARVCARDYVRTHRALPARIVASAYDLYGLKLGDARYKPDLLIPVELGGAVNDSNVYPQAVRPAPAYTEKNRLEKRLRTLVCHGHLPLRTAQRLIKTNWLAAYRRYVR